MKSNYVSIWFDTPFGNFSFQGRVIGVIRNNKFVIDPNKLFFNVFGFELPTHSILHYN